MTTWSPALNDAITRFEKCVSTEEVKGVIKEYLNAGGSLALTWHEETTLSDPDDYCSPEELHYRVNLQLLAPMEDWEEVLKGADPRLEWTNLADTFHYLAYDLLRLNWEEGFMPSDEKPYDEAWPYREAEDRLLKRLDLTREDISEIIDPWG